VAAARAGRVAQATAAAQVLARAAQVLAARVPEERAEAREAEVLAVAAVAPAGEIIK
jgi:hypothetical protein